MSTTPAARSTSSPARRTCATCEALGRQIGEIPEGLYPGDYLKPVGEALAAEFGDAYADAPESEWLELFRRRTVAAMIELIRADLALLGIHHDLFASEAEVQEAGAADRALALLDEKGLVYEGALPPPKGKIRGGLGAGRAAPVPLDRSSATTRTGRSGSRTAAGPISAPTPPIICRSPRRPTS